MKQKITKGMFKEAFIIVTAALLFLMFGAFMYVSISSMVKCMDIDELQIEINELRKELDYVDVELNDIESKVNDNIKSIYELDNELDVITLMVNGNALSIENYYIDKTNYIAEVIKPYVDEIWVELEYIKSVVE